MYPAAYAVDFEKRWYLPALGQLKVLVNRMNTINTILRRISGATLLQKDYYWSSSQENKYYAWFVYYNGRVGDSNKDYNSRVRSVRAF